MAEMGIVPNFLPSNEPSLTMTERTAFRGVNQKVREYLASTDFQRLYTFNHKQDGIDFFAAQAEGPQSGDSFFSTGDDGPGGGDVGVPGYWLYSGPIWGWMVWDLALVEYTPSVATISLGDGSSLARFLRQGRQGYVDYTLIFGSTTTLTSGPVIDLPGPSNSSLDYSLDSEFNLIGSSFPTNRTPGGRASFVDASPVAGFSGYTRIETAGSWRLLCMTSSGAFVADSGCTSTVPFTWAVNDTLWGHVTYNFAN